MDRRTFIGRGLPFLATTALAGCETAGSASRGCADDAFANRGRAERLGLGYAQVDVGLREPFSILHISDTHLTAAYPDEDARILERARRRTATFGGRQEMALLDSLEWAGKNADAVLHTGDLIDWQSRANLDLMSKFFGSGIQMGALGNHEFSHGTGEPKETPTEAFKKKSLCALGGRCPFDLALASFVFKGVNFLAIDDVYGSVTERQAERFEEEVGKGLPIVLCMHVPIYTPGIARLTERFWGGRDSRFRGFGDSSPLRDMRIQSSDATTVRFVSRLKREKLLKCVLAGHLHFFAEERFSETAVQYVVGGNFLYQGREVLFC